ncbi:hypothetical protein Vadar_020545 [Vaccinium darrowii]|uniref:Uncharacterized protein n=1 Tax=Vaccinium darrowii TaxID=229202 RepID=A0ACB7XIU9_9ERIC|nr:hypothetical protein Vadar_020545 [Vaccinium darrowii]
MSCSDRRNNIGVANWAELQQELLTLIAKRVDFLEDFSAFRRVCRSWRSVAVKENFKGSEQLPWLMLTQEGMEPRDYCPLFSATEGNLIGKLLLPEAQGKRCFETLGWFLTVSETRDMNLLHPLTRVQIPLPPISSSTEFCSIEKAVLSSCPCVSSKENNYVLMVIVRSRLKFWKPGEKAWTTIETPRSRINDMAYCKGQFYAVGRRIFVCDTGGRDLTTVTAQVVGAIPSEIFDTKEPFIVESNGEVLIVFRDRYVGIEDINIGGIGIVRPRGANRSRSFAVFKLDLSNGGLEELESLGDDALFLGRNASISVRASKCNGIRPNCIYYSKYFWGSLIVIGIYDMDKSQDLPRDVKTEPFSSIYSALWVTPYF